MAAPSAVSPHLVFQGKNYTAWKSRMQVEIKYSLNAPEVLQPIPAGESNEAKKLREENERKAMGAVFQRLGDDTVIQVRNCQTVREIFTLLDERYGVYTTLTALSIEDELQSMVLDPKDDVQKFFAKVDQLLTSLTDCGKVVTDDDCSQRYLKLLPRQMNSIRQTCASLLTLQGYTSSHVRATIMRECAHIRSQNLHHRKDDNSQHRSQTNGNSTRRGGGNGTNGNRKWNHMGTNGQSEPTPGSSNGGQSRRGPVNDYEEDKIACKGKKSKKSGYRGKNFDITKVLCYQCGQRGHYASDCVSKTAHMAEFSATDAIKFANVASYQDPETVHQSTQSADCMTFIGDSGCNHHIIREHSELLHNTIELKGAAAEIHLAKKGTAMVAKLMGDLPVVSFIEGKPVHGILKEVLYVPDSDSNFLSTTRYMKNGYSVNGEDRKIIIRNPEGEPIIEGSLTSNPTQIVIKFGIPKKIACGIRTPEVEGSEMHRRYGHMNGKDVEDLPAMTIGAPKKLKVSENVTNCGTCANAKMKRTSHGTIRDRASRILELVHVDLMGRILPVAEDESQYVLVLVDDWSHYTVSWNLKRKDDAVKYIMRYVKHAHNLFPVRIVRIRCDNGKEFVNQQLIDFLDDLGIILETVPPYTPELNAVVERMMGTIGNRVRALLYDKYVPIEWWHFAVDAAVYLINRSPTRALEGVTPYERWTNRKPDISHLRIFGSVARVFIPPHMRSKLDKRSWNGILVGFEPTGYKIYDVRKRTTVVTCDAKIDETKDIRELSAALTQNRSKRLIIEPKPVIDIDNIENIIVNKGVIHTYQDPCSFKEATTGADKDKWLAAIQEELAVMKSRGVWEVVPKPDAKSFIDMKWIFKRKRVAGQVQRFRARLCARGCFDANTYQANETYSPTAKLSTVRLILAVAVDNSWELTHLDVTAAFLYGDLQKEVYSLIPDGMDDDKNRFALKLNRSMYGLKVASKNWHTKLCDLLKLKQYSPLISEPNVFVNRECPLDVILLVFVDDFLVTGQDAKKAKETIEFLASRIEIRNLGPPVKFLGIELKRTLARLALSQEPYIEEMLEKYPIGTKRYGTPMEVGLQLKPEVAQPGIRVREILGSLMYSSVGTRPDVQYAVNYLCRFQEVPTSDVLKYAKRILSYLSGTKHFTLNYVQNVGEGKRTLTVMTDASHASDQNDRKSTTGILIKMGANAIAWRTLKQKCVTRSSTEAEYIAMSQGDAEVRGISNILNELKYDHVIKMFVDNEGAVRMSQKRDTQRLKHVDIAYRAVEESIETGRITIDHLPGELMEADLLTKSLIKNRHCTLTRAIMNIDESCAS